jgi:uncharacterized Zn-binding protein involved in type VI secretion
LGDHLSSVDDRIELPSHGTPLRIPHRTKAEFDRGLSDLVLVDGQPAAVVGSSGPNTEEHRQPKVGRVLVPLPTRCEVTTGSNLVFIDGRPVAHRGSTCRVPDAFCPLKGEVLSVEQDLLHVEGEPVLRGKSGEIPGDTP